MIIGYVILALSLCGFLAIGLGFGIKRLRDKKKWQWPKGDRVSAHVDGFTAHFVHKDVELEFTPEETARRAALAAKCLDEVLGSVSREFVVHVCDDATYNKTYDAPYGVRSNGMQITMYKKAGNEHMPLVACRGSAFGSTPRTGSLVTHELLHDALPRTKFNDPGDVKDHDHSDKRVWGSGDSVEGQAAALFVKRVS